jgi:hypothetical protein
MEMAKSLTLKDYYNKYVVEKKKFDENDATGIYKLVGENNYYYWALAKYLNKNMSECHRTCKRTDFGKLKRNVRIHKDYLDMYEKAIEIIKKLNNSGYFTLEFMKKTEQLLARNNKPYKSPLYNWFYFVAEKITELGIGRCERIRGSDQNPCKYPFHGIFEMTEGVKGRGMYRKMRGFNPSYFKNLPEKDIEFLKKSGYEVNTSLLPGLPELQGLKF